MNNGTRTEQNQAHHKSAIELNINLTSSDWPWVRHTDWQWCACLWPPRWEIGSRKRSDCVCVSCKSTCHTVMTATRYFPEVFWQGEEWDGESGPIHWLCNQWLTSGVRDNGHFIVNMYGNANTHLHLHISLFGKEIRLLCSILVSFILVIFAKFSSFLIITKCLGNLLLLVNIFSSTVKWLQLYASICFFPLVFLVISLLRGTE